MHCSMADIVALGIPVQNCGTYIISFHYSLNFTYSLISVPEFFMLPCDHFCAIHMCSWAPRLPLRMN
jgi:hypothetical protein